MGWFDWFRRSDDSAPDDPLAVRKALIDAVEDEDTRMLVHLCDAHTDLIREHAPDWKHIPEEIRGDPQQTQAYGRMLAHVAQVFAQVQGDPSLLKALGAEESDPGWTDALHQSRALLSSGDFDAAAELLDPWRHRAPGDRARAMALGNYASARFHSGRVPDAVDPLSEAVRICQAIGDVEGVAAWSDGLFEVQRWLGHRTAAAETMRRAADAWAALGQETRADRRRKAAELVEAGEPPLRVIVVRSGEAWEINEIANPGDQEQLGLARNRLTLAATRRLVQQAGMRIAKGAPGKVDETLRRAAEIDPHAPEPHYAAAVAALLSGAAAEALAHLDEVQQRAPGWYVTGTHRWCAEHMKAGTLNTKTFRVLHQMADPQRSPTERMDTAERALRKQDCPPLTLALGELQLRHGPRPIARDTLACAVETSGDDDTRTRALVALAAASDHDAERWLHQAESLGGNLLAAANATLQLRRRVTVP